MGFGGVCRGRYIAASGLLTVDYLIDRLIYLSYSYFVEAYVGYRVRGFDLFSIYGVLWIGYIVNL